MLRLTKIKHWLTEPRNKIRHCHWRRRSLIRGVSLWRLRSKICHSHNLTERWRPKILALENLDKLGTAKVNLKVRSKHWINLRALISLRCKVLTRNWITIVHSENNWGKKVGQDPNPLCKLARTCLVKFQTRFIRRLVCWTTLAVCFKRHLYLLLCSAQIENWRMPIHSNLERW